MITSGSARRTSAISRVLSSGSTMTGVTPVSFEQRRFGGRARECYDFVFILEQQRQQEFSDCAGATGNKDFH
jgi:hypothetical protein